MVGKIAATLTEADPANGYVYGANAQALLGRLDRLTDEIALCVNGARTVRFIVFHDGYRYFEVRFGLTVVGSTSVSPKQPPGVRRIGELRDKSCWHCPQPCRERSRGRRPVILLSSGVPLAALTVPRSPHEDDLHLRGGVSQAIDEPRLDFDDMHDRSARLSGLRSPAVLLLSARAGS